MNPNFVWKFRVISAPAGRFTRAAHAIAKSGVRKAIPVRTIRRLQALLSLVPAAGDRKIALIDGLDDVGEEGAATLLKSLEEPPPRTTFLLLADELDAVTDTILSRCQRVRFRPLGPEVVRRLMLERGGEEVALPDAEVDLLVRVGQGSVGRALEAARLGLGGDPATAMRSLLAGEDGAAERLAQWVRSGGRDLADRRVRAHHLLVLALVLLRDEAAREHHAGALDALVAPVRTGLESLTSNVDPELVVRGLGVRLARARRLSR